MPIGYENLRLEMSVSGMEQENEMEIMKTKVVNLGGIHFTSADNINQANKNRIDNFINFIKVSYPYIQVEEPEEKKTTTTEDLINAYKTFAQQSQKE